MKIDTYTKVLLTAVVLLLGVIAFDYRPNIEAKAGIMGGGEMILGEYTAFTHMKDGKFRACRLIGNHSMSELYFECSPFSDGVSK